MTIRDNLIIKYARLRLAADVAVGDAKHAAKPLTFDETNIASLAAGFAQLDWLRGLVEEPAVTREHIDRAIAGRKKADAHH